MSYATGRDFFRAMIYAHVPFDIAVSSRKAFEQSLPMAATGLFVCKVCKLDSPVRFRVYANTFHSSRCARCYQDLKNAQKRARKYGNV